MVVALNMMSSRRLRMWYHSNQCSLWYITLLLLLIIQTFIIFKHWERKPETQLIGGQICPQFMGGDPAKDRPTYVSQDRRYQKWDDNWDGRQFNRPIKQMIRRLFLVRHGEYHKSGPQEKHLTQRGQAQAHMVGQRLRAMNITFDRFISSSSPRAMESSVIIQKYLGHTNIQYSDQLKEGWPTYPEPPEGFDPSHPAFKQEGWRIEQAYKTFIHRAETGQSRDTNELLVAHGNVIGNFVLRVMQLQPERWLRVNIYQASLSIIEIDSAGMVRLRSLGDVGHLPTNMWTG